VRLLYSWWPVTIGLLIAAVGMMRWHGLQRNQQLRSLPSMLLLFPVLIVLWAAIVRADTASDGAGIWRLAVVAVLLLLHVAAAGALVYVSRSCRRQTLSLVLLIGWLTGVCGYVAGLALVGRLVPPQG
jgi:cytochrome bd-type quinol oxidase subunit 2